MLRVLDKDQVLPVLPPTDLVIALAAGWSEHPHPDGIRELRAAASDDRGVLQVSRFVPEHTAFVSGQPDLGAFAVELGHRLGGAEKTWGQAGKGMASTCALGRLGMAVFAGGQFPAMILLVTVSPRAAYMWTYLGPSLDAPQVEQALGMVKAATERVDG